MEIFFIHKCSNNSIQTIFIILIIIVNPITDPEKLKVIYFVQNYEDHIDL